jgi:hypothetical protein
MPYKINKVKCKQSTGTPGSYVLSYKDKKGKKHRACHTSKKKAKGQIAAIEIESIRLFVKEIIAEEIYTLDTALAGRHKFVDTSKEQSAIIQHRPNDTSLELERQNNMKLTIAELRSIIKETIQQNMKQVSKKKTEKELDEDEFTYAIAKAAKKGDKTVNIDGEKFPVKMSKEKAKDILGNQK